MVREELQILNGHEFFPLKGKMRKLKFPYYLVKHAQTFFFFFFSVLPKACLQDMHSVEVKEDERRDENFKRAIF
jgi:hypothetical protein